MIDQLLKYLKRDKMHEIRCMRGREKLTAGLANLITVSLYVYVLSLPEDICEE